MAVREVREVKLCLLGDSGVGKSSIVLRFVRDQYKEALEATIGASFMTRRMTVDDKNFVFQIWDTAGQEKYRSLAPMYYRGASAAIVVYDVTSKETFGAVQTWVKELNKNGPAKMVIAVAGNKCDLEDLREVRAKDAKEYADQIDAIFTETSAVTAVNIPELFASIAKNLPPVEELYNPMIGSSHKLGNRNSAHDKTKKSSCCSRNQS